MNKKALIIFLVVLVAVYFIFIKKDRFDQTIYFEGQTYSLAKSVKGGEVTNYFFTPSDQKFEHANEFIQLIVFNKTVPEQNREDLWKQLKGQYGLESLPKTVKGFFGHTRRNGVDIVAHAKEITVDEGSAYLIFIRRKPKDFDVLAAKDSAPGIITSLAHTESLF